MSIHLHVNGARHEVDADPDRPLLAILREELHLYGTKYGCGEAQCGACTVWLDGRPVRSCVTRAGAVAERPIVTIEGLASGDELHPLQEAFLHEGAMQCGYCTPGMIMAGAALLERTARPSESEILEAMDGNVCRCGVHTRIVAAIRRAADVLPTDGGPDDARP